MERVISSVTVEWDCDCTDEMCSHGFDAVKAAVQKAYDQGVEDGIKKAMVEVRSGLRAALTNKGKRLPDVAKKTKKVLLQ